MILFVHGYCKTAPNHRSLTIMSKMLNLEHVNILTYFVFFKLFSFLYRYSVAFTDLYIYWLGIHSEV